jgi:hypothetical protein
MLTGETLVTYPTKPLFRRSRNGVLVMARNTRADKGTCCQRAGRLLVMAARQ